MTQQPERKPTHAAFFLFANPLLFILLLFSSALLFYSCAKFYTFLPTVDTWAHVDFIAQATTGKLDTANLFAKHNQVHLLVLPKLIYFLDAWLGKGSGLITANIALFFVLASSMLVCHCIYQLNVSNDEKIFCCLTVLLLLTSPIQTESLLNPANVQWALLNFFAVLSAYALYKFYFFSNKIHLLLLIVGIVGVAFSSASAFLIIVPVVLIILAQRYPGKIFTKKNFIWALFIILVILLLEIFRAWLLPQYTSLFLSTLSELSILEKGSSEFINAQNFINQQPLTSIAFLSASFLTFISHFIAPPLERLNIPVVNFLFLFIAIFFVIRLSKLKVSSKRELVFFQTLCLFALFTGICIGLLRSFHSSAYTFRFANLGLLFAAGFFIFVFIASKKSLTLHYGCRALIVIYLLLLSIINSTETFAFGHGRNHLRLTQVAYALDIRDSFVVAAMPGTVMEKHAFEFIQANKHKLQTARSGVYASKPYRAVGKKMTELGLRPLEHCDYEIQKMRRLIPEQAAYKLIGRTITTSGDNLTGAYFVDSKGVIRGYAIDMIPGDSLWANLQESEYWAGFVNLDNSVPDDIVFVQAYNDAELCPAEKITLPVFKKLNKKKPEAVRRR